MSKARLLSIFFIILGIGVVSFSYFHKNKCLQVPVSFSPFADKPLIKVRIEDAGYSLLLDLGSSLDLVLCKEALGKIQKKEILGSTNWMDLKGNTYSTINYRIPFLELSSKTFRDLTASEESMEFITRGSNLWPSKGLDRRTEKRLEVIDGKLGWTALKKLHCYFDFSNSVLFIASSYEELSRETKISKENLLSIPFSVEMCGLILLAETDYGKYRFLLDTGATKSILRKRLVDRRFAEEIEPGKWVSTSERFKVSGEDFGPWNFILYEISEEITEIDGILGIDFFKRNSIYLDFENQIVYFNAPR